MKKTKHWAFCAGGVISKTFLGENRDSIRIEGSANQLREKVLSNIHNPSQKKILDFFLYPKLKAHTKNFETGYDIGAKQLVIHLPFLLG